MRSEYVEIFPGLVAYKYNICGTNLWSAALLQAGSTEFFSSITTVSPEAREGTDHLTVHGWYGHYTSARIPLELDALPALSLERCDRVHAWFAERCEEAYSAIVHAFPEFETGQRSMGMMAIQQN